MVKLKPVSKVKKMAEKKPYQIVKYQHVTEKALMLQELKNAKSNPSVARCESPKYVFIVDPRANKQQIADAIEEIYKDKQIKVVAVNTINIKGKPRRVRGRIGKRAAVKKAIVTLEKGDSLDNV
jgi:large subunit ribosomal protein L23